MAPGPILRFDQFEADSGSGELRRNGERLRIQEQPFQLLVALLERPGEVVTRDELRQRLWPSDTFVDFDHGLNATINKLREALGDSAANPKYIETLPRRGYRFLAKVESEAAIDPSEAPTGEISASVATEARKIVEGGSVQPSAQVPPEFRVHHELPEIHPSRAQVMFILLQLMYLVFYVIALARFDETIWRINRYLGAPGSLAAIVVMVSAAIGTALRLYTTAAASLRYRWLGRNFRKIFPGVLVLDLLWAMSPFVLVHLIGIGLAFAACAALVYSPFAQRVLASLAFPRPME